MKDRDYVGYDQATRRYFRGPQALLVRAAALPSHDLCSLAHEAALREEPATTRARGCAASRGERQADAASIAGPVVLACIGSPA